MTDKTKGSQVEAILRYLEQGNEITPIEALNKFGCFRLGARIWDLRDKGIDIKSRTVCRNDKRFSSYYLAKNEKKILGL